MSGPVHQKPRSGVVHNENLDLTGLPLSIYLPSALGHETARVRRWSSSQPAVVFPRPAGNCWRKTVAISITETALPVQGVDHFKIWFV